MKILHISTYDRGGAANAALRLHQGLLNLGKSSKFLCLHQSNRQIPEVYSFSRIEQALFLRGLKKLGLYQTQADKNQRQIQGLEGKYDFFSFPNTDYDLTKHPLVQEADVIHLHWVANLLDWPSFFKRLDKPIVWTLHDMNPFQGGFHYAMDVERNQGLFGSLESALQNIKAKSLEGVQNLTITPPSQWLTRESQSSAILGAFFHQTIPYGLDTDIFRPQDQDFSKKVFGIPKKRKVLLFVADSMENPRKGMDLLNQALLSCSNGNMVIVTIGGGRVESLPQEWEHLHLGRIQDERLMALAYSAADLFVVPSREDNLPNTVLESLACGTPVVGYSIGGIPDMVIDGKNGFLGPELSPEALALTIQKALDFTFNRAWIREDALRRFDQSVQAQRYIKLYKSINQKNQ